MVDALRDGEKCVCDLQALVGDDMSTVSKHLSVLREAGVVFTEKRGQTSITALLSVVWTPFCPAPEKSWKSVSFRKWTC